MRRGLGVHRPLTHSPGGVCVVVSPPPATRSPCDLHSNASGAQAAGSGGSVGFTKDGGLEGSGWLRVRSVEVEAQALAPVAGLLLAFTFALAGARELPCFEAPSVVDEPRREFWLTSKGSSISRQRLTPTLARAVAKRRQPSFSGRLCRSWVSAGGLRLATGRVLLAVLPVLFSADCANAQATAKRTRARPFPSLDHLTRPPCQQR